MAVRIEDTLYITIQLGGKDWRAGSLIHQMRMNLMRQHVGEKDPFSGLCYISLYINIIIMIVMAYHREIM